MASGEFADIAYDRLYCMTQTGWLRWVEDKIIRKVKKNRSGYWVLFVNNKITNNDDKKNGREIVRRVLE